ncbi:hypothetical protein HYN56_16885 [Flavobacterium crocinum]|uniref:PKD-like family protein n=1 Tax=Flavobacterium crocinum TaxID=2183896 RepID=A0A2S1YP44_9FLAO|nr:PKD-like family lipoprotein [Flavobacterium crocinum]AWK05816.1 hypothetical protein HYN56_16885 [Flavobacterium crocinum]
MRKANIFKLLSFLFLMIIMVSCYDDKGNYEYQKLDEVTIDVSEMETSYSILRYDTLTLQPKVIYKGTQVNPQNPQFKELSFSWEMYPAQINRDIQERHDLATTLHLHKEITANELVWEVLFTVTNTNTGVKTFAKFPVAVTPSLAEGWMVLYEKDGNTDVGLITNNEISKTATNERVYYDLYANANGAPIPGKPGSLIYSLANLTGAHALYIQSSNDAVRVDPTTFRSTAVFNDKLFWTPPAVKTPEFVTATIARKEFLINNNQLHVVDYTIIAPGDRAFNDALAGSYGKLAPWMATATSAAFDAILYDQTNKRFVKVVSRGAEIIPIATAQAATAAFDVNNVGLELIDSDLGFSNFEHILMKDAVGSYFLLTANFIGGETTTIGRGKYNMSLCPEIASVNAITAGAYGEVFYYSSPNNLYQFKYTPGTTDRLWAPPAGESITTISLQKYYNQNRATGVIYDPKNFCKILYIATYNESTKIGSVYQMGVNETNGAIITGTEKKYTGFGKIKAMAWKPFIVR